jgi:hypothetical protein
MPLVPEAGWLAVTESLLEIKSLAWNVCSRLLSGCEKKVN